MLPFPEPGPKLSKLSSNGASTMTRCGRIRASPAFARLGENLDKLTGVAVRRIHGNNSRSPFEPSGSFSKSVPPAKAAVSPLLFRCEMATRDYDPPSGARSPPCGPESSQWTQ
jgi:hypothetical protein